MISILINILSSLFFEFGLRLRVVLINYCKPFPSAVEADSDLLRTKVVKRRVKETIYK